VTRSKAGNVLFPAQTPWPSMWHMFFCSDRFSPSSGRRQHRCEDVVIQALLPSGATLATITAKLSWTCGQVKDAILEYLEKPKCISALLYGDRALADDELLEHAMAPAASATLKGSNSVSFGVIVSMLPILASIAEQPGMSALYKFESWTASEIYPGEEDFYRAMAAGTECYFLKPKRSGQSVCSRSGNSDDGVSTNARDESLLREVPKAWLAMGEEWAAFYDELVAQGRERERKQLSNCIHIIRMGKCIDEAVRQALVHSYEGLDVIDFTIQNNVDATAKYQIIDGHSEKPIKFADHETKLYIVFTGKASFSRTAMELEINAVYLSSDEYCGVLRPCFM